jgi:hypothetical protein
VNDFLSDRGRELKTLETGDLVTLLIRPPVEREKVPAHQRLPSLFATGNRMADEQNPRHYRVKAIWRVLAVNGAHAAVECVYGPPAGCREMISIPHHRWFEARDLYEALTSVAGDKDNTADG